VRPKFTNKQPGKHKYINGGGSGNTRPAKLIAVSFRIKTIALRQDAGHDFSVVSSHLLRRICLVFIPVATSAFHLLFV
jgi:hypothetical protein